jgi:predicted DNA-binding transcriptional regulator AlpA
MAVEASLTYPPAQAALLTEKELAAMAKLSPAMLQKLRRESCGPAFVRIGSAIRYPVAAVYAWLAALPAQR